MPNGHGDQTDPAARPRSWRRRLLVLPPIAIGVAVLALALWTKEPPVQAPPAEIARTVRVITVSPVTVVPRITGFGTVRPANVWNAIAQVNGRVVYVHPDFKKGAILEKGTEIIRIDPADYELAIAEAQANIRSAEAKLAELKVNETNLRATLKIEQQSVALKKAQLQRVRDLLRRNATSQAVVDKEERDTLAQQRRVTDIENQLRLLPTQRAVQMEQIAVYRSKLQTAKLSLSRTRVTMPFRGLIAEANVEKTQYVQVGTKLGVADDIATAEIEAQFPIAHIAMFGRVASTGPVRPLGIRKVSVLTKAAGLSSIIRLDLGGRSVEWKGDIVRVSPTIDQQTRTVGIVSAVSGSYRTTVPGVRPPLAKGMFVEVELRARPLGKRLVVPRSASHAGKLYVVNKDSRLEIRDVKVGLALGNFMMVTGGLAAGDKVIVSDLSPAVPGMLLKTVEDKALRASLAAEAAGRGRAR